ncbi:MAG: hypothetical protein PHF63_09175 [Herbinix sp.]|nr:hypothetical protein [Herbinix sp.]
MIQFIRNFKIKYIIPILIIFIIVFFYYFSKNENNNNFNYENGYRVDQEPIKSRFPELGDFVSCYWKGDTNNKNSRSSIPAPTSYWMKGFIILDIVKFNKYKNDYEWTDTGDNWKPSIDTKILKMQSFNWYHCDEFDKFIKPEKFTGYFYLDFDNGVLYFDIEVI